MRPQRKQRYYIPEKIIPNEENQQLVASREHLATFANVDFQRIRFWCLSAAFASTIPRRLGPYASREELAHDKTTSRKINQAYMLIWGYFSKDGEYPPPPEWENWPVICNDPLLVKISATVIWPRQLGRLIDIVTRRENDLLGLEEVAKSDGIGSWYNTHNIRIDYELSNLYRIKDFADSGPAGPSGLSLPPS